MTDSYTMSDQKSSPSLSIRTIAQKKRDLIRLCMSASTLEIFGPQNGKSVTWPPLLQKPSGDKATDDEQATALPTEESQDSDHRQRSSAGEVFRSAVHAEAGGLRDPGVLPSTGNQANTWIEQEIHSQLSELGQIDPIQGIREGQRHDHQQASQQHQELGDIGGAGAPGVHVA